jgi:CHAT domain-containing protein
LCNAFEESALLLNAFFSRLAAGQSKTEALRYAQRLLIQQARNSGHYPHPYFWGAYTVTGR